MRWRMNNQTLEELGIRGRETFMAAGGESFRLIPCLNHSDAAIECLHQLRGLGQIVPQYAKQVTVPKLSQHGLLASFTLFAIHGCRRVVELFLPARVQLIQQLRGIR